MRSLSDKEVIESTRSTRNVLHMCYFSIADTITFNNINNLSHQLYDYMLSHDRQYDMKTLRMASIGLDSDTDLVRYKTTFRVKWRVYIQLDRCNFHFDEFGQMYQF